MQTTEKIMNLDQRLSAIAKYIPANSCLGDIGTDHAYLPAVLLKKGKIARAIATDVAIAPCKVAQTTLSMQGVTSLAEVRQGDGLKVLKPGECDTIVMAGMGGSTIIDILSASPEVAKAAKLLIFQPMIAADKLRKYLIGNGFTIIDEDLVEDDKFLYEIIVASPGVTEEHYDEKDYLIGPKLLFKNHPLLMKQIFKQKEIVMKICTNMEQSPKAINSNKYKELKCLLEMLSEL